MGALIAFLSLDNGTQLSVYEHEEGVLLSAENPISYESIDVVLNVATANALAAYLTQLTKLAKDGGE